MVLFVLTVCVAYDRIGVWAYSAVGDLGVSSTVARGPGV